MSGTPLARPRRKGISLTPLIDMAFILLMSTFTRWKAVALRFPVADSGVDQKNPQTVILHTDGSLSLRGRPLFLPDAGAPAADGPPALAPARSLVVFPEADTRVQTILTAFKRLTTRGVIGASLGAALSRRTER